MKTKKIFASVLALVVSVVTLIPCSALSLGEIATNDDVVMNRKITSELTDVIKASSESDLIPIYIFRNLIPEENINNILMSKTGMDAEMYEDEELFKTTIVPQILNTTYDLNANTNEAIELAASNEADRYISAKRNIVKQEYETSNQAFIEKNISDEREILYCGSYTSTIIVNATPFEIAEYAKLNDVERIDYFEDYVQESELDIVLPQVNANIPKSSKYNSGAGYTGAGVKIGIIEADCGQYDASAPHLSGISSSQLSYVYNYRSDGTYVTPTVSPHATKVTSIIMGKSVTVGSRTLEGIATGATVYQTSVEKASDVYTAFNTLVGKGVNIINYSGGSSTSGYTSYDKEIDNLIATTKVTFVKSAGNSSGEITSPGKAINAITVGNAETKSDSKTANSSPYSMYSSSSYSENSYLPNKPDIVAPGARITTAYSSTQTTSGSGTSYSAPMVTGIIAQSMQRVASFKTNPYTAKAAMVLFSEPSKISTTNNSTAGNTYLRDKSGAGLINANYIVKGFTSRTGTLKSVSSTSTSNSYSYKSGQKLRIVLVFGKSKDVSITSSSDMDDIDVRLLNSDGTIVASSTSSRNNVEIIEYNIPSDGSYSIQAVAHTVRDTTNGVPFSICWMAI